MQPPVRLPTNYRLVFDVVRGQEPGVHAAAVDVFARAKLRKPSLGYSTVYRALNRLCELGLILEVQVPGLNAALYEPVRADHAHFVCRSCGAIEDVDCDLPLQAIAASVAERDGEVDGVALTIHGRCTACRRLNAGGPTGGPGAGQSDLR